MTRLLFALAVVFLLIWWFRRRKPKTEDNHKPTESNPQALIPCAHCGVMVPESEAFTDPQHRQFCSAEHLSLANQEAQTKSKQTTQQD